MRIAGYVGEIRQVRLLKTDAFLGRGIVDHPYSSRRAASPSSRAAVLKTGKPYYDRTADYEAPLVKRNAPLWIRMLRRYGYITPTDAQQLRAA